MKDSMALSILSPVPRLVEKADEVAIVSGDEVCSDTS